MEITQHEPEPFNAVGVYVYAAGFSVGVKKHFNILAHLEDGQFGGATVAHNHPEVKVFSHVPTWEEKYRAAFGDTPIHFIHSNPPCAPWSMGGKAINGSRGLQNNDTRVECVHNSFNMFLKLRPRAWAWESVARTANAGRDVIEMLAEQARGLGYATTVVIVEGTDLGVAQRRKRTFVVVHNFHIDWKYRLKDPKTVRDVLGAGDIKFEPGELANMSRAEAAMVNTVPPGGSLRDEFNQQNNLPLVDPNRQIVRGRPAFSRRRVPWDAPSFTMIGGPHLFHPEEDRLLSVPECAALCGFPADYKFISKSVNDKYAQVAKGVMPPVGEWLAENIARSLQDERHLLDNLHLGADTPMPPLDLEKTKYLNFVEAAKLARARAAKKALQQTAVGE